MRSSLIGVILLIVPALALAHTGPVGHGFAAGLAHPVSGLDHLLAMTAVGLWAAQIGGRALWAIPSTFLAVMAGAALLGATENHLPLMEVGIAGSVVIFGLLISMPARLPLVAGTALTGLLGIFHGFAHGAEMATNASFVAYSSGFIAATAGLLTVGLVLGTLPKAAAGRFLMRASGAATAAAGVFMLPGAT